MKNKKTLTQPDSPVGSLICGLLNNGVTEQEILKLVRGENQNNVPSFLMEHKVAELLRNIRQYVRK